MKVKNIKAGVRVQHKGTGTTPSMKGALGTCLEADNVPYVQWDDATYNVTEYRGKPCRAITHTAIRKVKE